MVELMLVKTLEFGGAAHVVAVARRAVGDHALRRPRAHLARLKARSSVLARHAADPAVGLDAHQSSSTMIFGNSRDCSPCARAASRRPRAMPSCGMHRARALSGSATTVGAPAVGLLANAPIERQRAEQRHVVFARQLAATVLAEDALLVAAVGAHVQAHVLDHAEHGHADFLEHLAAPCGHRPARCPAAWSRSRRRSPARAAPA